MSKIQGKAKRYDGSPVDYVLLFDWPTGNRIGKSTPDQAGNWTHEYSTDLNCGIAYVADGCEPIAHGPYEFIAEIVPDVYGYLFICYAQTGGGANDGLDFTKTSHADWNKNFKYASDNSLLKYTYAPSGVAQAIIPTTTLAVFDINWVLELRGLSFNSDLNEHLWTVEFLDANNNVIAAVKSQSASNRTSQLWYGPSLTNLTKTSNPTGAGSIGELSFTAGQLKYRNTSTSANNGSFTLNANMTNVVSVRISGNAKSDGDYTTAAYSGGYLKVISPIIT